MFIEHLVATPDDIHALLWCNTDYTDLSLLQRVYNAECNTLPSLFSYALETKHAQKKLITVHSVTTYPRTDTLSMCIHF